MNQACLVDIAAMMNTPEVVDGAKKSDVKIVPMGDNWGHVCCILSNNAGIKIK